MDWSNERWVKLYTRDTSDFLLLSWQARGLFALILRAVNRRGEIDLGRTGARSLAVILHAGHDAAAVIAALDELLADGCIAIEGQTLRVVNFEIAQSTPLSDAARARAHREKLRDEPVTKRDASVTKRDGTITKGDATVTGSHAASRGVTHRVDKSRGEQNRSEESRGGAGETDGADAPTTVGADAPPALPPAEQPQRRTKRAPKAPRPDELPMKGSDAWAVYEAITSTPSLAAVVRNPGDFATGITSGAYPNLSARAIAAAVRRAGGHAADNPGRYSDGRAFLRNWLARDDEREAARGSVVAPPRPAEAPSAPSAPSLRPVVLPDHLRPLPEPIVSDAERAKLRGLFRRPAAEERAS